MPIHQPDHGFQLQFGPGSGKLGLAYHLMAAILRELKRKGINHQWETIRDQMATQVRITTAMTTEKGERVYIRQTTEPEPFHYEIHRALGILPKPLRTKRFRV